MTHDLVFILMLTGHVLGDFYGQTDKMAQARKERYGAVLRHSLVYGLVMAAVMAVGLPITADGVKLFAAGAAAHALIDSLKYLCEKQKVKSPPWVKRHLLLVDQALHLGALAGCWAVWGQELEVRWFVSQEIDHLPALPIIILLGVLCILRPVGIMIAESELRNYKLVKPPSGVIKNVDIKNAGKTIGYLERLIVFFLLMYQQFSAIAFVLTAKSVARFKEIEKDQAMAEYYLIGTLMSVGSAMIIAILLGVCN